MKGRSFSGTAEPFQGRYDTNPNYKHCRKHEYVRVLLRSSSVPSESRTPRTSRHLETATNINPLQATVTMRLTNPLVATLTLATTAFATPVVIKANGTTIAPASAADMSVQQRSDGCPFQPFRCRNLVRALITRPASKCASNRCTVSVPWLQLGWLWRLIVRVPL
jgi:hypothetical protein